MNSMKIKEYNPLKRSIVAVIATMALFSCSDWTETESLNIKTPTLEEENPALYEAYISSLNEYKKSEHKVTIVKFDNKETDPAGLGESITALPVSIDFVILNNADNLNAVTIDDMQKIRLKGTHTLYSIDYSIIEKEYEAMLENEETPEEDTKVQDENTGEEEMTTDRFLEFCEQRMEYYLGLFSKYKYDGINVIYSGIDPLALSETEKSQLEARQQIFFGKIEAWKNTNVNATFIFEGKPQNLLYDKSLLQKTNFIIIPVVDAVNREDILFTTNMALVEGVPTGRIIYGVTIPSLTDSKDQTGYFEAQENGSPMYAVKGAALAVISNNNNNFVQTGLCISRSQNDYYFGVKSNYKNIKEAISIMNPSPLN